MSINGWYYNLGQLLNSKIKWYVCRHCADYKSARSGQLLNKKVGGTDVTGTNRWQQVDYKYNIRGWLTDINSVGLTMMGKDVVPPTPTDDLFSFKINYNFLVNDGGDYVDALYNGNIAQTLWKTASDNKLRGYIYEYDRMNRMTDAIYYKQDVNPYIGNYNEHVAYDLNGNIISLNRYGGYENQTLPDEMDLLAYTYNANSNLLVKVVDNGQDNTGFIDSATNTTNDYTYNANGSMITDKNKNITAIKYNHLNLPTQITFGNGTSITYLYNAAGQKVNKLVNSVPVDNMIKSVDYMDGFQYTGGELNFFQHAEGYVNVTLGTTGNRIFNYVYYYTDHLGNIRLTYTKDMVSNELKIMDENHYYPFGLKHQKYSPASVLDLKAESEDIARPGYATSTPFMYKYNGQEFQDELGLNMYAMDMRQYDPAIARWGVPDPVIHHSMSPYNAFDNNPVFWADPSGANSIFEPEGTVYSGISVQGTGMDIGAGGAGDGDSGESKSGDPQKGTDSNKSNNDSKGSNSTSKSSGGKIKFSITTSLESGGESLSGEITIAGERYLPPVYIGFSIELALPDLFNPGEYIGFGLSGGFIADADNNLDFYLTEKTLQNNKTPALQAQAGFDFGILVPDNSNGYINNNSISGDGYEISGGVGTLGGSYG